MLGQHAAASGAADGHRPCGIGEEPFLNFIELVDAFIGQDLASRVEAELKVGLLLGHHRAIREARFKISLVETIKDVVFVADI